MTVATRKIILSGLLGIVSTGMIAATTYAAQPPQWIQSMSRPVLHEIVGKAIEDDDYNAFANAIKDTPGAQSITYDQFNALVSAYKQHVAAKIK
jgi:hypothetical protein